MDPTIEVPLAFIRKEEARKDLRRFARWGGNPGPPGGNDFRDEASSGDSGIGRDPMGDSLWTC